MRLLKLLKSHGLFWLTVVVPTALAIVYFGFVMADVYISESRLVVRSPERQAATPLGMLLRGTGFIRAQDDSFEEMHAYCRRKVGVRLDPASSIFTVTDRAFDAASAQGVNQMLLVMGDALVNQLNERGRQAGLRQRVCQPPARQLASALATLEQARNGAQRQQLYIERVAQPSLPDEAMEPCRLRAVLAVFVLGLVAWGVSRQMRGGSVELRRGAR
jgi:capsular polysaccharide transport system permease protein